MNARLILVGLGSLAVACGPAPGDGEPGFGDDALTSRSALRGRLSVSMSATGAILTTAGDLHALDSIMVDIDAVTAHSSTVGWVDILSQPVTIDIAQLGAHALDLGFADLPAGRITQIRLHVAAGSSPYVTTPDGLQHPLRVPSGMQSGIKLKGDWSVAPCSETQVTLRMDRKKSIHVHRTGNRDRYTLRPVIFSDGITTEGEGCETPGSPGAGTTDGTPPNLNTMPEPGDL